MSDSADAFHLRPAETRDREFVRELSRIVFSRFGPYDELLSRWMRQRGVQTVVAEASERVGFAMHVVHAAEGELLAIAAAPSWQRRGVGRALLAHVEASVAAASGLALRLTVAQDNAPALSLFERAGFVLVPDTGGTYPAGQPSLTMRKLLR